MKRKLPKTVSLCLMTGLLFHMQNVPATAAEVESDPVAAESMETEASLVGQTVFAQCQEYINVREEASTDSDVTAKIYNHGSATIEEQDGEWYKIHSGNAVGYVKAEYFASGEEAAAIAEQVAYHVAVVHPGELNIRSNPDDESEVIASAQEKDELEVVAWDGDWMKVALGQDVYGYVNAYYVDYKTYYPTAETVEEEKARLLAEQAAAETMEYTEESEAEPVYTEEPETEPVYTETSETEPVYTEEPGTEPVYTEESETEPVYTEEPETEPVYTETPETEPVYTEEPETEPVYTEEPETEPVYTETPETEPVYTEESETESVYTETPETEPVYTEEPETEPVYTEAPETELVYTEEPETEPIYTETPETEPAYTEEPETESSSSGTGQQIADFAVQYVGNPYVWGGTSLTNGADCSGFVQTVFSNFGIGLARTAESQAYGGTQISLSDLQPGDLLFYNSTGSIDHVAIYIGGGQIVHAANSSSGIIISNAYYQTPVSAARYF